MLNSKIVFFFFSLVLSGCFLEVKSGDEKDPLLEKNPIKELIQQEKDASSQILKDIALLSQEIQRKSKPIDPKLSGIIKDYKLRLKAAEVYFVACSNNRSKKDCYEYERIKKETHLSLKLYLQDYNNKLGSASPSPVAQQQHPMQVALQQQQQQQQHLVLAPPQQPPQFISHQPLPGPSQSKTGPKPCDRKNRLCTIS